MRITNEFLVPLPVEESWRVLLDVPRIAPCLPGARLEEVLDDGAYAGSVAVRLGPIALVFKGRAQIVDADPAARQARVRAEGRDTKGRGAATAEVAFALFSEPGGTRVEIVTDLTLSGSIAQFARAADMIDDVANHLIGQFAGNLHRELEAGETGLSRDDRAAPGQSSAMTPAAPIQAGTLGVAILWRALLRFAGRILGRTG